MAKKKKLKKKSKKDSSESAKPIFTTMAKLSASGQSYIPDISGCMAWNLDGSPIYFTDIRRINGKYKNK